MVSTDDDVTWDIDPAEAFSTLGHETRMDVLWALWETTEPVGYAALRRQVAPDDQGNFGYHLDKLTGHFVSKSTEGYELRLAGERVVRAVVAGTITADPSLSPQEIESQCSFCDAPVEICYEDETITVRCTDCDGLVGGSYPRGTFMHYEFPPGGLDGRSPTEIADAASVFYDAKIGPMMRGICPACAGQVETDVEVCTDHVRDEDGLCPHCNMRDDVWTTLRCERCRYTRTSVLWIAALSHPAVVSYYHDHGIDEPVAFRTFIWERAAVEQPVTVDVLERDPHLFRITIDIDGDRIVIRMTETLAVRSVERNPAQS